MKQCNIVQMQKNLSSIDAAITKLQRENAALRKVVDAARKTVYKSQQVSGGCDERMAFVRALAELDATEH